MNQSAPHKVNVQKIDATAFAPFGHVFDPKGHTGRNDHFDVIENKRSSAAINLAQVQADNLRANSIFTLTLLERHPYSSQSFFPQDVERYLVIVCENSEDNQPRLSTVKAFSVPGSVSITYKPNVWHAGISVLEGGRNFLVLIHEDGSSQDCEFVTIPGIDIHTT